MGRIYFQSVVIITICVAAFHQVGAQSFTITGEVRDSSAGYTLAGVTVAAYLGADSSLIDVQLTNNTGGFTLTGNVVNSTIDLYVSYTGYQTFKRTFLIDSAQPELRLEAIRLVHHYEELNEVIVKMAPPVSMNGDTLEINPGVYRLGENAVVEDLLRKVNGIVVWGDGTITVNGKKVEHVYVDGRPFISDNARIATQNLPKSAIEKVQIYQERNANPQMLQSDSLLSMNIQLKEDRKNGFLGKAVAGYGTSGRYDAGLTGILFTRQSRVALAVLTNNINKKISGVQSALENSTYKNTNPNLADAPDFEMNGENTNRFYGGVFQHSFKPKKRLFLTNDIRVELNRSENEARQESEFLQQSSINDNDQTIRAAQTAENRADASAAVITYSRKTAKTDLTIAANLNDAHTLLNENQHSTQTQNGVAGSENLLSGTHKTQMKSAGLSGVYNHTDTKNLGLKTVYLSYDISYNQNTQNQIVDNQFQSFIIGIPDISTDKTYDIKSDVARGLLLFSYPGLKRLLFGTREFRDLEMSLNNQLLLSNDNSSQEVADYDPATQAYYPNAGLTYRNIQDSAQYRPGITVSKTFGKYLYSRMERSFALRLNMQANFLTLNNSSDIARRKLNRSYAFFEPELALSYQHQNNNRRISLSYTGNTDNRAPCINQLYPVTDSIDAYYIPMGNPLLATEHRFRNMLSFGYRDEKINRKNHFSASANATYEYSRHALSDSMITDEAGRSFHYPVNVSFRKNWIATLQADYSIRLRKNLLQIQYRGTLNKTTLPGFINNTLNISDYLFSNHRIGAIYSISDVLTAEFVESIILNQFRLTNHSGSSRRNNLFNTALNLNYNFVRHLVFSNSLNYLNNPAQDRSYLLWNTYLTARFSSKEKYEVKLSAFDLLRNYKNIRTEIGYNFNATTVNASLQQFFMVSFTYFPRFF